MLSLVLANNLLYEVLRFSDLKLGQQRVFNISVLRVEVLYCILLHGSETVRDIDTTLLYLALDLAILDQLLSQLLQLLLFYPVLL